MIHLLEKPKERVISYVQAEMSLYPTILIYTILFYTVLYYTTLYYTISYYTKNLSLISPILQFLVKKKKYKI